MADAELHRLAPAFLLVVALLVVLRSWWRSWRARRTLFRLGLGAKHSLPELSLRAVQSGRKLVRFAILVPAHGKSRVIANALIRLSGLNYDPRFFSVYVIADAHEKPVEGGPPTAHIASALADLLNRSLEHPVFHVLHSPEHGDGRISNAGVPALASSQGRALNVALRHLQGLPMLPDLIGVLDADGRLDPDGLIEAGWRYLVDGSRLLQGPVFQVARLDRVDLFGVMAGLENPINHLPFLASQLCSRYGNSWLLSGANYFICPRLLLAVGGWRSQVPEEAADLGLRLFLRYRIRADRLACAQLKQSSPSPAVSLKQSQRWLRGHLQLLLQIRQSSLTGVTRLRLYGQVIQALISGPLTVLSSLFCSWCWPCSTLNLRRLRSGSAARPPLSARLRPNGMQC